MCLNPVVIMLNATHWAFAAITLAVGLLQFGLTGEGALSALAWMVPVLPLWIEAGLVRAFSRPAYAAFAVAMSLLCALLYVVLTMLLFWNYQAGSGMGYAFVFFGAILVNTVVAVGVGGVVLVRTWMEKRRTKP